MATASEQRNEEVDPAVAAQSETGWRRWISELGRYDPERVASFSVVVAFGLVLGVLAMYAFIWLADEVLAQETTRLDSTAAALVRQFSSPAMDALMRAISLFGSELVMAFTLLLLGLFVWQRRWGAAVLLVVVDSGAQLLNDLLKGIFHRARPIVVSGVISVQQYSFPSGHAMVSAAFYTFIGYLVWRLVSGWWRWLVLVGLVLLVVCIGISRIYLQAHYLSDVIAGYVAGLLWSDAVIVGSRALRTRRRRTLKS